MGCTVTVLTLRQVVSSQDTLLLADKKDGRVIQGVEQTVLYMGSVLALHPSYTLINPCKGEGNSAAIPWYLLQSCVRVGRLRTGILSNL